MTIHREVIEEIGIAKIEKETLSDNSIVYNVIADSDDKQSLHIGCRNKKIAFELAQSLDNASYIEVD